MNLRANWPIIGQIGRLKTIIGRIGQIGQIKGNNWAKGMKYG